MPEPALRRAQSILGLDGVRVLAELAVIVYHLPGRDRLLLAVVQRACSPERRLWQRHSRTMALSPAGRIVQSSVGCRCLIPERCIGALSKQHRDR